MKQIANTNSFSTRLHHTCAAFGFVSRSSTRLLAFPLVAVALACSVAQATPVSYLVVGGGGGGARAQSGYSGGGGGGGGVLSGSTTLTGTSYAITVGLGGNPRGNTSGTTLAASIGGNSTFNGLTALGGGYGGGGNGGWASGSASSGGSGGGGASNGAAFQPGALGTAGQGYAGGNGNFGGGGGGGGAGATGTSSTSFPGNGFGGVGFSSSITGALVGYAGGGGGGRDGGAGYVNAADGGGGGGGNTSLTGAGLNGTDGKGGGGGGAGAGLNGGGNDPGGKGGSGVVIVSYTGPTNLLSGGDVTTYGSGENTTYVHTFTTSGTLVVVPEPSMVALLGAGLTTLGAWRFVRRRRAVPAA